MSAILKNMPVRQETNLGPSRTRMPSSIVLALCVGMFSLSSVVYADVDDNNYGVSQRALFNKY